MSGRKNVLPVFQNITAQSMGANITSAVTDISYLDNVGIELVWSAGSSPVGLISVEGSIDYFQDNLGNVVRTGNWTALTLSPSPAVSGNTGTILLDMNQLSFPFIRVKYTRTSGSGTLNGYICGKQV